MSNLNVAWLALVNRIIDGGEYVNPRRKLTLEICNASLCVNMRYPVLTIPERKLGYRFMAAEAYWILSGDYLVANISPYSGRITQYSDDSVTFFGAYGPKIASQLTYVVMTLASDLSTRQAGLTIWRESPMASKDVPCTVAIFFRVRNSMLDMSVFMRSSDAWLGIPYDVFNFSMLGHLVCARLIKVGCDGISPGQLHISIGSSHIYAENVDSICAIINQYKGREDHATSKPTPVLYYLDESVLMTALRDLRESNAPSNLRWWL